jgi:serine/threonine protein kinase
VKLLIRKHKYIGRIVPVDSNNNTTGKNINNVDGLICVEEIAPKGPIGLPKYIVNLPSYTEKDCRVIFRQIVSIIKLCHDNGLAHRNILFTSLLVDSRVCIYTLVTSLDHGSHFTCSLTKKNCCSVFYPFYYSMTCGIML